MEGEIHSRFAALSKSEKPKILLCTPEITELPMGKGNLANLVRIKGGGLGDISAALINFISKQSDYELHIAIPRYDRSIQRLQKIEQDELDKLIMILNEDRIHLVNDSAFSKLELYGEDETHSRIQRSAAYQRHIINYLLPSIYPDIVHCNDWMTGLIPAAAKSMRISSLYTLHNIFTEKESMQNIHRSGINIDRFKEFCFFELPPGSVKSAWRSNPVDFTATGIFASDIFNTVSPTFLKELVKGYFPEMVPLSIRQAIKLKHDAGCARGILNAPGDSVNPKFSKHIIPYTSGNFRTGKNKNKTVFQKETGLIQDPGIALYFWPSRLFHQKGPWILYEIALEMVNTYNCQIAVIANGEKDIERIFGSLACASGGKIAYQTFSDRMSEMGKAAADFILMPSLYEPCGLPQMEGPRFGTLPVVRATGGLNDTVTELNVQDHTGNGFRFNDPDSNGLRYAFKTSMDFYNRTPAEKNREITRIMEESLVTNNLANTAGKYIEIYEDLLKKKKDPSWNPETV